MTEHCSWVLQSTDRLKHLNWATFLLGIDTCSKGADLLCSRNCFCYELDFLVSRRLQYILKCTKLSTCAMGWFSRQKRSTYCETHNEWLFWFHFFVTITLIIALILIFIYHVCTPDFMQCYTRRNLKYGITFLALILCTFPTNFHNIVGIQFPSVANILNSIVQNSTSKSDTFVRFQTVSILFHENLLESREVLPRILPTCNFCKIKWKIQRIVKKKL